MFISLFILSFSLEAQIRFENIVFSQQNDHIYINYDLYIFYGSCDHDIMVYYTINDGESWNGPLSSVSGDIENVCGGFNKEIIWDVLKDKGSLIADNLRIKLVLADNDLHESLRVYESQILLWETNKFTIRVDSLQNNKYRYASWSKPITQKEEPDLILTNGNRLGSVSSGKYWFEFKNDIYTYKCETIVNSNDEFFEGYLSVYRHNSRILYEPALNIIEK